MIILLLASFIKINTVPLENKKVITFLANLWKYDKKVRNRTI